MSDNSIAILLEEIRDQNTAVLEAVGDMQKHVARIPYIEEKVDELEKDMKVVKTAITETNQDLRRLEIRVDRLEAA